MLINFYNFKEETIMLEDLSKVKSAMPLLNLNAYNGGKDL